MKKCVIVSLLIFFIICICSSISSATDLGGAVSSATSLEWTVSSGTNLSTLRLNREGLSPEFNKDIKEYYFIAQESINSLDITAIPESSDSKVTITGNNDLSMGRNVVSIKVESNDGSEMTEYKIFVTRTNDFESANANLEMLAIREVTLNPEFDANVTMYKAEIANNMNKLEILAIPQNQNASVNITGGEQMQTGDNKVEITVLAEDGITDKKYEVEVYKRNDTEEIKNTENQIEAKRLSASIKSKYSDKQNNTNNSMKNNDITKTIIGTLIIVFAGVMAIVFVRYRNKK